MRELLEAAGRSTGLLGTVKSVIGGVEHEVERTTPEAIDLQRTFSEMRAAGDVACAIEVSSHALELHRADAIHFAAAVFTNLTQDHLDFHPTMEDYFAAKRLLFSAEPPDWRRRGRRSSTSTTRTARGWRRSSSGRSRSRCAATDADYRGTEVETGLGGSTLHRATRRTAPLALRSPLRGEFNVYNVIGALAVARALGRFRGNVRGGDRHRGSGARPLRDRRRGAAVRGGGRLCPHA